MLPRVPLVLFFALFLATAAGLGLAYAAERDDRLPAGTPPRVTAIAPRCYSLETRELPRLPRRLLPTYVQLLPEPVRDAHVAGWYDATRWPTHPGSAARWRPAGADSLDVSFPGWPIGLRVRIARQGLMVGGRALVYYDAGGLPEVGLVIAMAMLCPDVGARWSNRAPAAP